MRNVNRTKQNNYKFWSLVSLFIAENQYAVTLKENTIVYRDGRSK